MIKTIVKRDGSKEPFEPSKINNWGKWAARTLGGMVDWGYIVLETVSTLPEECSSQLLHERLIKTCLDQDTWSYNRMAGRLYASAIYKDLYGGDIPTIREVHQRLHDVGLMVHLDYSDVDYQAAEEIIDHSKDLRAAHFELEHARAKYALRNRTTDKEYESQQFIYMRMAMALAENRPRETRMDDVEAWYRNFSDKKINAPTPNFINLGTPHKGFASCCVYTTDDNIPALAAGDHIAYTMTAMSAGIGAHINTRSKHDPVRGGAIRHQGKLPYYRSIVAATHANIQAGRGGAATTHYNAFDPEVNTISRLKNAKSTEDNKIRGMDYSIGTNKFFARKAGLGEDVFLFNSWSAPDLYAALYSDDLEEFERLYKKYEQDESFPKKWASARGIAITALNEGYETGRLYLHFIDEMNRHTPFKEPIYSSNLCQEIALVTKAYQHVSDLYSLEDHGQGEIGLCSLGAINIAKIASEKEYAEAAYYTLLMIDICIHMSHYALPHLGLTAKSRLNAGVGIVGYAHWMAKHGIKFSTQRGKDAAHEVAERHYWHLTNASLQLAKEFGPAPWIHKTKWVDGWLPLDTYNKNVDTLVTVENKYDWESLRTKIRNAGGIRNSVLAAYMPSESSSKSSGTTNGIYPVRDLTLIKTDRDNLVYWAAPESDRLGERYDRAYEIPSEDMIDIYAIFQKWTDQTISADLWRKVEGDEKVGTKEMMNLYLRMVKFGVKTRYYQNTKTSEELNLGQSAESAAEEEDARGCASGVCDI